MHSSLLLLAFGLQGGHGDAHQYDQAVEELLPVGVDAQDQHGVGHQRDDAHGHHRAEHRALAAVDRSAAEDDGGDDGHLLADHGLGDGLALHAHADHADEAGQRHTLHAVGNGAVPDRAVRHRVVHAEQDHVRPRALRHRRQ